MTGSPAPQGTSSRLAGFAVLGLAIVIAGAVAAYLFTSGDDGQEPVVRPPAASQTPGISSVSSADKLGPLVPQRPEEGKPAPDFALVDAHDESVVRKLSDFRGTAVVVNWYASWCGPCKAEIPEFEAAHAALGDQVVFLGVNFQESSDRATGILDLFQAKYPAVLDDEGKVAAHYRVSGLPATFFVDKDGVLRGFKAGQVSREDLVTYLAKAGVTYTPE